MKIILYFLRGFTGGLMAAMDRKEQLELLSLLEEKRRRESRNAVWALACAAIGSMAFCAVKTQADDLSDFIAQTNGAVLIRVNKEPEAIIFFSKTGDESAISVKDCSTKPACVKLVSDLRAAGKTSIIDIETDAQPAKSDIKKDCAQDEALVDPQHCGKDI